MTHMTITVYRSNDDVHNTHEIVEGYLHDGDYRYNDLDMMSYDDFGYLDYIELMS